MSVAQNGRSHKGRSYEARSISKAFGAIASAIARAAGRPGTFILAVTVIVVWAVTGPLFGFSDTWQLIINTGTTIVTFLMVFLIQNSQNRDGAAIQVKLDELIRVSEAKNRFVGIEHLTDEELEELRDACEARARGERGPRVGKVQHPHRNRGPNDEPIASTHRTELA
jgi:low affinity Fe/Cu permease